MERSLTYDVLAGADGCRDGWIIVQETAPPSSITWRFEPTLEPVLDGPPQATILAVDIPIGLPLSGPRECDREARRLLGRPRGSSVFPAPIRPVLHAASYAEAGDVWFGVEGKRLSRQAWGIVPKVRAVDNLLQQVPSRRANTFEAHPEVSFYFMANRTPMLSKKKSPAGRHQRATILREHFGVAVDGALSDIRALNCAVDDLLDAFACLWTARRIENGRAVTLPVAPPLDSFGLPMQIVA